MHEQAQLLSVKRLGGPLSVQHSNFSVLLLQHVCRLKDLCALNLCLYQQSINSTCSTICCLNLQPDESDRCAPSAVMGSVLRAVALHHAQQRPQRVRAAHHSRQHMIA